MKTPNVLARANPSLAFMSRSSQPVPVVLAANDMESIHAKTKSSTMNYLIDATAGSTDISAHDSADKAGGVFAGKR